MREYIKIEEFLAPENLNTKLLKYLMERVKNYLWLQHQIIPVIAEEIFGQAVLITVLKIKEGKIDDTSADLLPYLNGIASNLVRQSWDRRRIRVRHEDSLQRFLQGDDSVDAYDVIPGLLSEKEHIQLLIQKCMEHLSSKCQVLINLRFRNEDKISYKEIIKIFAELDSGSTLSSEGYAKKLNFDCLQKLRRLVKERMEVANKELVKTDNFKMHKSS